MPLSAEPFEVVPVMLSADSATGDVVFSEPVTCISAEDVSFLDVNTGSNAAWMVQATPSTTLNDTSLSGLGSTGDTYESLGGSVIIVPAPAIGTVTAT